jgi:hypothetical protein
MNKDRLTRNIFGISVLSLFLGGIVKILHIHFPISLLFSIGLASTLIYTIIVLIEIFSSDRIRVFEKVMWIVGFIFINTIAGFCTSS